MSNRPFSWFVGGVGGIIGVSLGTTLVIRAATAYAESQTCRFVRQADLNPLDGQPAPFVLTWECGTTNMPDPTGWIVVGIAVVVVLCFFAVLGLANLADDLLEAFQRRNSS